MNLSFCQETKEDGVTGTVTLAHSPDSFMKSFVGNYESHTEERQSLLRLLNKAAQAKMRGHRNPQYEAKAMNFFIALEAIDRKAFDFVSAQFLGPGLRAIQCRNAKDRSEPYIVADEMSLGIKLDKIIESLLDEADYPVAVGISIDGTKVPSALTISMAYHAIFGGAFPNHCIPIDGMDEQQVKLIIAADSDVIRADEVKVAVLTLQKRKQGKPCFVTLAGQPQTLNMNSSFNDVITKLVLEKAKHSRKIDLASVAADGVGCDNHWIMQQLIDYMEGKTRHVGIVDPNHNAKNGRYQYFGGSSSSWMGKYILDPELLRIAHVPKLLWRIKDFASDLLVLKLASYETVNKQCSLVNEDAGCIGIICATLYFMRARLCSVNSKTMGYRDRMILMWTGMLWHTSLGYSSAYKTNQANMLPSKRNSATEAIGFMFLFPRNDVENPRYCTTEPTEHTFGGWRVQRSEATIEETIYMEQKRERKNNAIFAGDLATSRNPKNGYQATWANFVSSEIKNNSRKSPSNKSGEASVTFDDDALVEVLWPYVKPIIDGCAEHMKGLLKRLGVNEMERSPFLRDFDTPADLLRVYKSFIAKTSASDRDINEDNCCEESSDDAEEVDQSSSGINSVSQLDRIKEFIDVTLDKGDGTDADLEVNNDIQEQNDCTSVAAVQEELYGEYTSSDSGIADAWEKVVQSDVGDLAYNCRDALCGLHATNKARGSINNDRKKNSLLGRWLTHKQKPSEDDANSNDKIIERNIHVKVEMKEKRHNQGPLCDLVDYRVLAVDTKTYNKWYLCENGRQAWSKTTGHKKYRVLLQMITYDHFKQKWRVCDPSDGTKWTKTESYYVLVDAGDIHDVVGRLSED